MRALYSDLVHGWDAVQRGRGVLRGGLPLVGGLAGSPQAVQVGPFHHQPPGPPPTPFATPLVLQGQTLSYANMTQMQLPMGQGGSQQLRSSYANMLQMHFSMG